MSLSHDPRAEALVAVYPAALRVARRHYPGLHHDDHEVIVQDAMVRVLGRLAKGPLENPVPYLFRVVRTAGAQLLHERRRDDRHVYAFDGERDLTGRVFDRSTHPAPPEERVLDADEARLIWRVLCDELPARERLVLVRRWAEERGPAEIAAELGITLRHYRHVLHTSGRHLAAGVERARIRADIGAPEHPDEHDDADNEAGEAASGRQCRREALALLRGGSPTGRPASGELAA